MKSTSPSVPAFGLHIGRRPARSLRSLAVIDQETPAFPRVTRLSWYSSRAPGQWFETSAVLDSKSGPSSDDLVVKRLAVLDSVDVLADDIAHVAEVVPRVGGTVG